VVDVQASRYAGEWMTTTQTREALGLTTYKLARLMGEAGVKRYKLAAKDMRTWYVKAEDVERLREVMEQPREASLTRAKAS
jgi:hypothetical protein